MLILFTSFMVVNIPIGCFAANILVFHPLLMRTHYIQVEPIFKALAFRGHNVTEVSPFPPKSKITNFHHIYLSVESMTQALGSADLMSQAQNTSPRGLSFCRFYRNAADMVVPEILESPVFSDLIHGHHKFDLIFTEYFLQEAFVVLGHIFNAPVITYFSVGYHGDTLRFSGALHAAAYLPDKFNNFISHVGSTGLIERLDNAWSQFASMVYNDYWYFPAYDALLSRYIEGPLPPITDMLRNVSMYFLTANIAADGAKVYPPNVLEISGLHIGDPEPLDQELKSIMDASKVGVIYFSFGTLLNTDYLKKDVVRIFLTVFKELDQTVLWKTNLDTTDLNLPKNVFIRGYFNQMGILAHPNCVLFLTHGGISSIFEAINYAVPIVGMPFFADQDLNVANAEHYGYGLRLFYKNLTEKSLRWAIKTTLGDSRFKENISKASRIFADRPMTSLDTAIFWIEYVIRHRGAHHLKPVTVQMPWYQLFLLDIIAVFLMLLSITIFLVMKTVIFLSRQKFKVSLHNRHVFMLRVYSLYDCVFT